MTDADIPIYEALDTLSESDMKRAARQALDDVGLEGDRYSEEVEAIGRSLARAVSAVRELPTNMLVGAATADDGRGLRGEVYFLHYHDETRFSIDLDLVLLLLQDRGLDIHTCTLEAYCDADETCDLLLADAADYLFAPVVEAVKSIYHRTPT